MIGFTSGRIPSAKANLILLKGCQVVGVFWGDFRRRETSVDNRNFDELFRLYDAGKLHPLVTQVFPLEKYADALNTFINRKAIGKVIVEVKAEA